MIGVRSGIDEYGQPAEEILSGYVGEFKYFGFSEVPPHCLACDGSEVSRETYSELFAVFGTMYGAGNGATTFNLPDLRGAFLRCTGGNAAELGVEQGDAIRDFSGSFNIRGAGTNSQVMDTPQTTGFVHTENLNESGAWDSVDITTMTNNAHYSKATLTASFVVPTADEVRPVNYAVNICVVFE